LTTCEGEINQEKKKTEKNLIIFLIIEKIQEKKKPQFVSAISKRCGVEEL
jgi:hypothetical protein